MGVAKAVKGYLVSHEIDYDVIEHEPTMTASEAASASHISAGKVAKGVLIKGEDGYLVAVVPANRRVLLSELESCMQEAVHLASEDEAAGILNDCSRGAIPPVGDPYGLDVIIDYSMDTLGDVYFEGGDHQTLVHVTDDQFAKMTEDALHGSFSVPN
jgi:Ala-tRNA(Pro) deacylase